MLSSEYEAGTFARTVVVEVDPSHLKFESLYSSKEPSNDTKLEAVAGNFYDDRHTSSLSISEHTHLVFNYPFRSALAAIISLTLSCRLDSTIYKKRVTRDKNIVAFSFRFCKDENEFSSIEHMQRNTSSRTEEWFFFTIVREPIDRFLSAFVDKCLL